MPLKTFTNGQLFSLSGPLKELGKLDVPAKVGIRIARLIRALGQEIDPINEVRNKLISKYGQRGDQGVSINAESPNWAKFVEEHDALMSQSVKVEFEKVVLPDECKVDIQVLVALEPFLAVADIAATSSNGLEKEQPVPAAK